MIGGHDEEIGIAQAWKKVAEPAVEALEVPREPADVVAMAEERVEVHEVREEETAVKLVHLAPDVIHPLVVVRRVKRARDPAAGEQILYFSDRHDRVRRRLEFVEQRVPRRRQRVVPTIGCPPEMAQAADKRPRDHSPDAVALADESVCDFARAVQLWNGHDLFVRGNLEHAVG